MHCLSVEDLRRSTLARQFPAIAGHGADAVLELFARLGPIQSQVPRAPFLTASSRLPGVTYAAVNQLFAEHRLLKTSSLRGTVHTTDRAGYPLVDAVARRQRTGQLRAVLKPERVSVEELTDALEAYADTDWRPRTELVEHARRWLAEHESERAAGAVETTFGANLLWGHSGLLRRPKDEHWEKRTDIFHRRARAVLPDLPVVDAAAALPELIRTQLGAYGPLLREDLAYFYGAGLTAIDTAVATLGEEVVHRPGPDRDDYLDLAEPPADGSDPETVRLLPEFDGLLLGFAGPHRLRFLNAEQLGQVWSKVNAAFSPLVLADGRIVGTWKTVTSGRRTIIEVRPLAPHRPPAEDRFAETVRATEQVLGLSVSDLRIHRATAP